MNRTDIEDFLKYLRTTPMGGRVASKPPTEYFICRCLIDLETFISFLQKHEYKEAPAKSVINLIYPEDKPKRDKTKSDDIKYIPDLVWDQVVANIDQLPSEVIPLVLITEASGFRISDVCQLKINCLLKKEDGWWLVGDQRKVKEKDHRVPISEEIAKVIIAQQELTKKQSTKETNPDNFLFPVLEGKRRRLAFSKKNVANYLNELAHKCNILDNVDTTFLDFYQAQINQMESDIAIYTKTGRTRSIELTERKLKRYKDIRDGIIQNGGIYGQPKARREYSQEEREGMKNHGK